MDLGLEGMTQSDPFILMYHHVGDESLSKLGSPFALSTPTFNSQLKVIGELKAEVITVRDIFNSRTVTEAKSVVLTFDDCPLLLLQTAVPALMQREIKATFYAVSGRVGLRNDWDLGKSRSAAQLMDWSSLRELSDMGHEIGSHGVSHRSLRTMSRSNALNEMKLSRDEIEQRIGRRVTSFAYPFGDTPDDYETLCTEAGYESAVSIFSDSSRVLTDPFAMRRIIITERDTGLRFRGKLSRAYLSARPLLVDRRVLRLTDTLPLKQGLAQAPLE